MKKFIVISLITILVLTALLPSTIGITENRIIQLEKTSRGYIQGLIDNASDGDTIYIPSGVYYEHIVIDKSISLIGEDKNTTIIDGQKIVKSVVTITADYVNISGFSINNCSAEPECPMVGFVVESNYSTIFDNIMSNHFGGFWPTHAVGLYGKYNTLKGNELYDNDGGIILAGTNNSIIGNKINEPIYGGNGLILNNTISDSDSGFVIIIASPNTIVKGNDIIGGEGTIGIQIWSENNTIMYNDILNCYNGLEIHSSNNIIHYNNFINNSAWVFGDFKNFWDDGKYGNYWSDYKERYPDAKPKLFKPWMWDTPYEIDYGGDNQDNCPLIKQWPDSRPRTIPRIQTTIHPVLHWFLERFPLLERLLNIIFSKINTI